LLKRVARSFRFGRFDHAEVFKHIHETRYWGDSESVSGQGSSLEQTSHIREELPRLMQQFGLRSIFDAPCGDLYWMHNIANSLGADYIGGDIVPAVVEVARSRIINPDTRLQIFDILTDDFPKVDLWLCRDVLFHFSFNNIRQTVRNFSRSSIPYVLVTSHIGASIPNWPIVTGDFRLLNLFRPPFRLADAQVLDRFDDYTPPHNRREMVLISRDAFIGMID
jgi:hypothetical protein